MEKLSGSNEREDGFFRWINHVKCQLFELGMMDFWRDRANTSNYSIDQFKNLVQQRIHESYQAWSRNGLSTNIKCSFHHLLPIEENTVQDYITILDYKFVVPLARFRCRSNNMPIVVWLRDRNRSDDMPVCRLCHKNEVADEFHYLFVCSYFQAHRERLISVDFRVRANILKLRALFSSKRPSVLKQLSEFLP